MEGVVQGGDGGTVNKEGEGEDKEVEGEGRGEGGLENVSFEVSDSSSFSESLLKLTRWQRCQS